MTVLQNTQTYASELAITYDSERNLYLGEFTSRGGTYRFEGPDRADLMYQMYAALQDEYIQMTRDVAYMRSHSRSGGGRGRGGGGGSSHDNVEGLRVHRVAPGQRPSLSSAGRFVDALMTVLAISTGDWREVAASAIAMAVGDAYDRMEDAWEDEAPSLFAVSFCGMVITAASRAELKKKLLRQKHKRMHMIMQHIKMARDEREKNSDSLSYADYLAFGQVGKAKYLDRLRRKKRAAKQWRDRTQLEGRNKEELRDQLHGWRQQLRGKKALSKDFWVMRV